MEFKREIVLEPLVGVTEESEGNPAMEICHALEQIFLNGLRIGYVGHKPTDPINFIKPGVLNDKETLALIREAVRAKFKEKELRKVNGVPEITDEQALNIAEGIEANAG